MEGGNHMERFRFGGKILLSLVFVLASCQIVRSDEGNSRKPLARPAPPPQNPRYDPPPLPLGTDDQPATKPAWRPTQLRFQPSEQGDSTCRIYSLGELSKDPSFGKWVAETIQEVIQPGSWSQAGGKNVLRYNAPTGILVVYHSPAVQAQVEELLKNVKRSIAQGKEQTTWGNKNAVVVPAKYSPADSSRTYDSAASKTTAYPIPAQAQQPKHLFHFIIRYEGEGIIDSTVAGVLKQLYGAEEETETPTETKTKKKKKSDKQVPAGQTGAPALDQLFHMILRYEGEGIIDSTVADVIKAVYSGSNNTTSGSNTLGIIRSCAPVSGAAAADPLLPPVPMFLPAPSTNQPTRPTSPTPPAPSGTY
jgi:hypothetical protein